MQEAEKALEAAGPAPTTDELVRELSQEHGPEVAIKVITGECFETYSFKIS